MDEKYLLTIRAIRSRNFSKDLPFLILSDKLPEGQVYREFSDGHMELQKVFFDGPKVYYKALRTLALPEADSIRRTYGLL